MSQQYMFNRHVFLFHVMCLHALSWHEYFTCVCVCVHPFVLSAELVSAILCLSTMAIYCRMRKKGPPLLSANMEQTLRTLRAARGVKPDTLCGARCSATLECFSSMNIVRCRNRCVNNCFECYGPACGDHTCSMLSDPTIHDFPDFVAVKPYVFDDSWMISSHTKLRPTECQDEMVGTTVHFVAVDPQQYYQVGP
jgi:hypothetical protein